MVGVGERGGGRLSEIKTLGPHIKLLNRNSQGIFVGRMIASHRCPYPNPPKLVNVSLHGKADFADVIRLRILR